MTNWCVGMVTAALFLVPGVVDNEAPRTSNGLLIDDFSSGSSTSSLGTMWRSFTDRVMGGVSNGSHTVETKHGIRFMRLEGEVSLENNGGFVQAALDLQRRGQALDASAFTGVRLTVRGDGGPYYIHFKNAQTPQHWNYFEEAFEVTDEWRVIDLPFEAFERENGNREMESSSLRRIAIVAAHEAGSVDVCVARIELYR